MEIGCVQQTVWQNLLTQRLHLHPFPASRLDTRLCKRAEAGRVTG